MKAFFSYSRSDAELVEAVASTVGRPFVNIDKYTFGSADDLIRAVEKAVRESAIFVLFASRDSMNSVWVDFELSEARLHQALKRVRKVLVVLLDDRLAKHDFPDWMQRTLFLQTRAVKPIARKVRSAIDELVQDEQSAYFVGRADETARLQEALVPVDTTSHVTLLTLRGLPGVGRRTLLTRVVRDLMAVERVLTVRVELGDTVHALAVKLADLVSSTATPDATLRESREIENLSSEEARESFLDNLEVATSLREAVVLYDDGGLLDNDGAVHLNLKGLLRLIHERQQSSLVLVTNRRPSWRDEVQLSETPIVDIGPLQNHEVRQLLTLTARARSLELTSQEIGALVEVVRGYPPAVKAVVQLVETYGYAVAVGTANGTAHYQPRPLTRYLESLRLDPAERRLLGILARNSPLPIELLSSFLPSGDATVGALVRLIDASLIAPQQGTSWYRISEPVIDFVVRTMPPCTIEDYRKLAGELDTFLEGDEGGNSYLELSRVLYRALVHADRSPSSRSRALLADWLKLAEEFYHQREYDKALEFAEQAYANQPTADALTWKIRCLVRLGLYDDAVQEIDQLRRLGEVRESYFLRGFLERYRGDHKRAIQHYERARAAGRGGLALERDLAECYMRVGNFEAASLHIEAAQERQADNPYVVSLRVSIACRRGDEETARALLPVLDATDSAVFSAHRRSVVERTFGDLEEALRWAERSVGGSNRPPAETLANLAICQLRTGRIDGAVETLQRLEEMYSRQRRNVIAGLRGRVALAQQRFEDALAYCQQFTVEDSPVRDAIEREALNGLLSQTFLPHATREKYTHKLAVLARRTQERGDRGSLDEWDVAE